MFSIRVWIVLIMSRIIILAFVGVCVGQTPANTYLSLGGSPYQSRNQRLQDNYPANSFRGRGSSGVFQQIGGLTDIAQNNSIPAIHRGNTAAGTSDSEIDRRGSNNEQRSFGGLLVPQSRLLSTAGPQQLPTSLFVPGLVPIATLRSDPSSQSSLQAVPYSYDRSSENRETPSLRPESRSGSAEQINPQDLTSSLFSLSTQAASEHRSSRPEYQTPAFRAGADSSYIVSSTLFNALRRNPTDDYYPSYELPTSQSSNQNGYVQNPIQGPASYQFSYDVNAVENGRSVQFAHEEQRAQDQAAGAYSVLLPDGQRQVVEYTADHDGYRPRVSYANELGGSSAIVNQGPSADAYGNYESPVIAARLIENGGRQPNNIQSRYLSQYGHNSSPISPY